MIDKNKYFSKNEIPVSDPTGNLFTVKSENLQQVLDDGFVLASDEQVQNKLSQLEYGDRPVAAFGAGLARSATLGLSDLAATELGLVEEETFAGLQKENEGANIAGEIGGALIPGSLIGKAGKLAAKGVGLLGISEKAGLGKAALVGTVRGLAEGGAMGVQKTVTDYALSDNPELDVEKLLVNVATSANWGALFGGAGTVAGRAVGRSVENKLGSLISNDNVKRFTGLLTPEKQIEFNTLVGRASRDLNMNPVKNFILKEAPELASTIDDLSVAKRELAKDAAVKAATFGSLGSILAGNPGGIVGIVAGGSGKFSKYLEASKKYASTPGSAIYDAAGLAGKTPTIKKALNNLRFATTISGIKLLTQPEENESEDDALKRIASDLNQIASNDDALNTALDPAFNAVMDKYGIDVAIHFKRKTADMFKYLQSIAPQPSENRYLYNSGQSPWSSIPKSKKQKFKTDILYASNPGVAAAHILTGKASKDTWKLIKNTYPQLASDVQKQLFMSLTDRESPLSYKERLNIQNITESDIDPSSTTSLFNRLQTFVDTEEGGGRKSKMKMKFDLSMTDKLQT